MESILLGAIIALLIGFFYVVNQYWKENLRTKVIKAGIVWRSPRKYTKPKKILEIADKAISNIIFIYQDMIQLLKKVSFYFLYPLFL